MSHTTKIKSVPIRSANALKKSVERLNKKGIKCSLLENTQPRLYYSNQIARQLVGKEVGAGLKFHANPEECDYVLRLEDGMYDIGFLQHEDGSYQPIYDDYSSQSSHARSLFAGGNKSIRKLLGNPIPEGANIEKTESAGMVKDGGTAEAYTVGKFLQSYTEAATIEAAEAQGHMVEDITYDKEGVAHIQVYV